MVVVVVVVVAAATASMLVLLLEIRIVRQLVLGLITPTICINQYNCFTGTIVAGFH